MSLHMLKISGGPTSSTVHLELDGKPLYGVMAFGVQAALGDTMRATIVLNVRADIDAELELELLRAARKPRWHERALARLRSIPMLGKLAGGLA